MPALVTREPGQAATGEAAVAPSRGGGEACFHIASRRSGLPDGLHRTLTFVLSALKGFFDDEHFVTLLRAEKLAELPKRLTEAMPR